MICPECKCDCEESNFCPNCGTQIKEVLLPIDANEEQKIPPLTEPYVQVVAGRSLDLHKLMRMYGMGISRAGAYKCLQDNYGLSESEARELLNPLYEAHNDEKVSILQGGQAQKELKQEIRQARAELEARKKAAQQHKKEQISSGNYAAICRNCGDRLLAAAKCCPTCGKKDIVLVEKEDVQKIQELQENAPNPKENLVPKWKTSSVLESATRSAQKSAEKANVKQRIQENKANGIVCCPKCGSASVTAQKKGFGFVRGAIGMSVGIDVGLVAGGLGANKVILTCMNCGHQWKPGKK